MRFCFYLHASDTCDSLWQDVFQRQDSPKLTSRDTLSVRRRFRSWKDTKDPSEGFAQLTLFLSPKEKDKFGNYCDDTRGDAEVLFWGGVKQSKQIISYNVYYTK
ncbi:hypothetical protein H6501_01170 [Candidatus Woesearchaeota archaeon]|nr:hypothetical protein [Nanoarchaeota archaeon]MCB9370187.1 hypothetical protein [Candidatus Woesearchaeota archaeon]